MLFKDVYAVAVQTPDGIKTWSSRPKILRSRLLKVPFVRGIVALLAMLGIGTKSLLLASQYSSEEDEELSTGVIVLTAAVSLLLVFVIIKLVPLALTVAVIPTTNPLLFNLLDGLLRIGALIAYILVVSQLSEIKEMFRYHGAEHKVIHAYEQGDLSLAAARKQSRFLGRCSTTFIMFVLVVAVLIYSLTPLDMPFWQLLSIRALLLLPIAAVSYELIRWTATRKSWIVRVLLAPGYWLQRLTVREPSDKHLKVALAAVRAAQKAAS